MCWNSSVSMTTFILGIIISLFIGVVAYKQKKWPLMALSFGWTFVVCMQLFEYLLWINQDNHRKNEFFSRLTFIFNITQILFMGLIFLTFFKDQPIINRSIIAFLLLFYVGYVLYFTLSMNELLTYPGCDKHLSYSWWGQLPFGGWMYIIILSLIFLLLVRPLKWSIKTLAVILFFFALTAIVYPGSTPSLWCFFSVSVPVISYLLY